ncbi:MAG: hypothetical protein H6672_12225 [Anaerolineaceae bacterium]|nr:hypothetical protein [Anaerolineaceae bacterium]
MLRSKIVHSLRLLIFGVVALLSVILLFIYGFYPPPGLPRSQTRLIEWGWDTPFLQDMPAIMDDIQALPFDGIVLNIASPNHKNGLSWTLFGDVPVNTDQLEALTAEFANFDWGRLTDNFLRLNLNPGNIDWFDDYSVALNNIEMLAKLAHDLGFAGILFDTELYPNIMLELFNHGALPYRDRYDYDAYAEQVYRRGQDVIRAMNKGYPGLTVMLTYGPSFVAHGGNSHPSYSLLLPFIEGMIAATNENTILVDGFEESYFYEDQAQFLIGYKRMRAIAPLYVRDAGRYADVVRAGFGLWIENDCGDDGLLSASCRFTRDEFESNLNDALDYSDRYVWIYSQHINWYTGKNIPPEWSSMMEQFRR